MADLERKALGWDEMGLAVSAICAPLPECRKLRDRIQESLVVAEQRLTDVERDRDKWQGIADERLERATKAARRIKEQSRKFKNREQHLRKRAQDEEDRRWLAEKEAARFQSERDTARAIADDLRAALDRGAEREPK